MVFYNGVSVSPAEARLLYGYEILGRSAKPSVMVDPRFNAYVARVKLLLADIERVAEWKATHAE